ncbi:MAG: hypothetical protein H0Z39_02415 [Peptococcaceae bacterium]|nr:hypothetical protein [Peptococcaceae bacterium]
MSYDLFHTVRSDLADVRKIMKIDDDVVGIGYPELLCPMELSKLDQDIRPALVLLVSKLFGFMRHKIICLAAMVQLVFLALRVHEEVTDKENSDTAAEKIAVLFGDYLYSRFFSVGAEAGLTKALRCLANIVCAHSEAKIGARGGDRNIEDQLPEENKMLFSQACRLAGEISGAETAEQQCLDNFGRYLGIGYGFLQKEAGDKALVYFEKAGNELNKLPRGEAHNSLYRLVSFLRECCSTKQLIALKG